MSKLHILCEGFHEVCSPVNRKNFVGAQEGTMPFLSPLFPFLETEPAVQCVQASRGVF